MRLYISILEIIGGEIVTVNIILIALGTWIAAGKEPWVETDLKAFMTYK